eukprot:7510051-Pyramimonas_sp.AAC.1
MACLGGSRPPSFYCEDWGIVSQSAEGTLRKGPMVNQSFPPRSSIVYKRSRSGSIRSDGGQSPPGAVAPHQGDAPSTWVSSRARPYIQHPDHSRASRV